MPIFVSWARQFGKRRALDLVASQIAELGKRSEIAAAEREARLKGNHGRIASGGWCAPPEPLYDLLDLPVIGVKRGGIDYPMLNANGTVAVAPRSYDSIKMESLWT